MKKRKVRLGDSFDLSVTEADICNGDRHSEICCPIALALRRQFRNTVISVLPKETDIERGNYRVTYKNPPAARRFIARFDDGKWVEPCVIRFAAGYE